MGGGISGNPAPPTVWRILVYKTYNRSLRIEFLFSISAIYLAPDPDTLHVLILKKKNIVPCKHVYTHEVKYKGSKTYSV